MATPTGPRAQAARNWFARERRRTKQNQKDFDIAGVFATPHDFGAARASAGPAAWAAWSRSSSRSSRTHPDRIEALRFNPLSRR